MPITKRTNVSITRGETPGTFWIEGPEGTGVLDAVQLVSRQRNEAYTHLLYRTFCGTRIYAVTQVTGAPSNKWVTYTYTRDKEQI